MLVLNAAQVRQALPMPEAIDAMREAFGSLHRGTATIPVRTHVESGGVTMLTMPGVMSDPPRLGAKIISIAPQNAVHDLPVIQGVIVVFNPNDGKPMCLLDGQSLTAIRTGAVSGLATDLLARPDATRLAVLGSGPQALTQVDAVRAVRTIEDVAVWSRTAKNAMRFAKQLGDSIVRVAESPSEAIEDADIICTATRATDPIVCLCDVRPGAHVNAVGSYTLDMRELDIPLLASAFVVVDDVEAVLTESGEIVDALDAGDIRKSDLNTLGSLLDANATRRTSEDQITVFKSVGVAVQDLSAAGRAAARARELGIGNKTDI